MEREQIDNWCGRGILGLVLAALVFGPLSAGAVGSFEFLVIQGLTLAAASLWVVRVWLQENYRLLFPPICWVVICLPVWPCSDPMTPISSMWRVGS